MSAWSQLVSWTRAMAGRGRMEREMDAELRFHLEAHAADLEQNGVSKEEALRRARIEFGGMERAKEECRDARGVSFAETMLQDLRYGFRALRKSPGFAVIAVLTLAIGIGANTAIFSVVNAILLHPLAYTDADKLVTILKGDNGGPVAVGNYVDWREQSRSYVKMGAAEYWAPNLTGMDNPEHLFGLRVTQNLFPLLGATPELGRLFVEAEEKSGSEHEVILSYGLWQRRFSGARDVIGQSILLDGVPYTVVGVMPRDFRFAPFWATHSELWVPLAFGERIHSRDGNSLRVFGRLGTDTTLAQARAEMATITARLEQAYPGTNREVKVTPLKEKVVGKVEAPLLVLLGAVGFVLLMACANVAHMLLARAAGRQKEIAVRAALGAGRMRMIRQFLTENLLLAGMGGAVGLLLAFWGTRALVALSPANIPRVETVAVDGWVVLFLLGVTVMSSIGFGLAPAMQITAVNLSDTLKENARGGSEGVDRSRLRSFLVASEFALALVLLIGAGLMVRSFLALQSVDPGFDPHHVLSMIVSVTGSKEARAGNREVFYRQLLEKVNTLPGVESAAGINHLPLAGDAWGWPFAIEGKAKPLPGEAPMAIYRIATPGYFQTMRIPIIRGRDISTSDNATAPGVVVINQRAAKSYWPEEDAIGKRISFSANGDKPNWLTIIGIVKDAKQEDWAARPSEEVYLAAFQNREFMEGPDSHSSYLTLVVRTAGEAAALTNTMKETVWSFDRNLPISEVLTMNDVVATANAQPRFEMMVLAIFAAVALVLAAVGIYGVMSYTVSRRAHEIGIRISLGASRKDMLMLVLRQGMVLALWGAAAGIAGATVLSRLMTSLLYGVKATDPLIFGGVTMLLMMVALVASCMPAIRAMRVDPIVALRHE